MGLVSDRKQAQEQEDWAPAEVAEFHRREAAEAEPSFAPCHTDSPIDWE